MSILEFGCRWEKGIDMVRLEMINQAEKIFDRFRLTYSFNCAAEICGIESAAVSIDGCFNCRENVGGFGMREGSGE